MSSSDDTDSLTLHPSRAKLLGLTLVSIGFTAIGFGMVASRAPLGGLVLGFFALCALVLGGQFVFGRDELRLDAEGIHVRTLFRADSYAWREIQEFGIVEISPGNVRLVGFVFAPEFKRTGALAALSSGLCGCDGALPDTYGETPEELLKVLEKWKGRCAP